jgi:hypothetical protein
MVLVPHNMKIIEAILMTIVSLYMALSGIPFPTLIGIITSIMAFLYWFSRIKMQIDRYHEGSLKKWLKYFLMSKIKKK